MAPPFLSSDYIYEKHRKSKEKIDNNSINKTIVSSYYIFKVISANKIRAKVEIPSPHLINSH
jgi:hypothetical protein